MTTALTALQVLLGLIFLFTGIIKLTTPKGKLPEKGVTGFEGIAQNLIKWLASTEIAGACTFLIISIPSLPKFPIKITASGFALLMLASSYHHYKRQERKSIVVTLTLLLCSLFILYFK